MHNIQNSPKKINSMGRGKDIVLRSYENFDQSFKDIILLFSK